MRRKNPDIVSCDYDLSRNTGVDEVVEDIDADVLGQSNDWLQMKGWSDPK